jgi:hypothetical protein
MGSEFLLPSLQEAAASHYPKPEKSSLCVISGFRHDVDEICALLGHYAA